ncbi:hypothetical protein AADZ90_017555 [Aestuariibius sp. 2305UL40-4]|uniref:hypothetical protein n=1 Tax=Aestuariibius violaceus TaxID=3234132 RepID=UPI00345E1C47
MRATLLIPLILAACTQFPELDARLDDASLTAPYPTLAPLDQLLAQADQTGFDPTASLEARADALRARAARLRAPVIEPRLRRRMLQSITLQQRGV